MEEKWIPVALIISKEIINKAKSDKKYFREFTCDILKMENQGWQNKAC